MKTLKRVTGCLFIIGTIILLILLAPVRIRAAEGCLDGQHRYDDIRIVEHATEEMPGIRRYTCIDCGVSYDESTPALGHVWGEWQVYEATCTQNGVKFRICDKGHREEIILPAHGHDYSSEIEEPSCTSEGRRTYRCSRCGDTYTEVAAALGHEYDAWITDTQDGRRYRVCRHNPEHIEEEVFVPVTETIQSSEAETGLLGETETDLEAETEKAEVIKAGSFNSTDVILLSSIAAALGGFGMAVWYDVKLLIWHRGKVSAYLQSIDK